MPPARRHSGPECALVFSTSIGALWVMEGAGAFSAELASRPWGFFFGDYKPSSRRAQVARPVAASTGRVAPGHDVGDEGFPCLVALSLRLVHVGLQEPLDQMRVFEIIPRFVSLFLGGAKVGLEA
jgi:hypothetical protein